MAEDEVHTPAGGGDPTLAVFLVALPDPIPLPHGSTLSFEVNAGVPLPLDMALRPRRDLPPVPGTEGRTVVSLKFWQMNSTADQHVREQDAIQKVVQAMKGDGAPSTVLPSWKATITVVEMVTIVESSADAYGLGPRDGDPFWECLNCLRDVVDAYRVSEDARVAPLSYERLGPLVVIYHRTLQAPYIWTGPYMMMLDHRNVPAPNPEQLDEASMKRVQVFLHGLRIGHPFTAWVELARTRDYAFLVDGDYRSAVIYSALATEVLVSTVLACILWEKSLVTTTSDTELDKVTDILKRDSRNKRAELGKLIGGNWDPNGDNPSARWQRDGAALRNRVVHIGYRATREEASRAVAAANALETLIRSRLAQRVRAYPRTAGLLLGKPGLKRLGALSQKVESALTEVEREPDWVVAYLGWRKNVEGRLNEQE